MVLVYFRGLALDGAVSIISGPFNVGDVGDGCPFFLGGGESNS